MEHLYKMVEQGIYIHVPYIINIQIKLRKQTGKMLLKSCEKIIEWEAWYSLYAVIPFS